VKTFTGVIVDKASVKKIQDIQENELFSVSTLARTMGLATNTLLRILAGERITLVTMRKLRAFLLKYPKD
jgi:hypothetical protein